MSSENISRSLDRLEVFPGDTYIMETTTETTYVTETDNARDRDARASMPGPSSGDYPTNPTTEHRYGVNVGTGVYDANAQNVARTTYTIRESDFERTAPDSGEGIHAYHGRELGSIPIGTTTVIHDSSAGSGEIDPEVHARILESEKHLEAGQHHVQRQILHEKDESLTARKRRERELEERSHFESASGMGIGLGGTGGDAETGDTTSRGVGAGVGVAGVGAGIGAAAVGAGIGGQHRHDLQHERDLQRDRQMAIANERERITRERIDTRRGSIHGLFGRGRHRDAVFVGRDTDATDFGNKTEGLFDAHRDVLSTSGSEHDRLIGTITGRERLAREQDAKFNSLLGSQSASGDAYRYSLGAEPTGGTPAPTANANEHNITPQASSGVATTGSTNENSADFLAGCGN